MKILIDIPEDVYTRLFDNGIQDNEIAVDDICEMARALRLGTPIPDNATNGEIADLMFPDVNIGYRYWFPESTLRFMDTDWWHAQYQKGGRSEER